MKRTYTKPHIHVVNLGRHALLLSSQNKVNNFKSGDDILIGDSD